MTNRIRIALAALLATLGLAFTASTSSAEVEDQCAKDPDSMACLSQIADEQCTTYGPESIECLSARNDYLEAYSAHRDSILDTVYQWADQLQDRITTLEKRVQHLKAKVKRLKAQLNS